MCEKYQFSINFLNKFGNLPNLREISILAKIFENYNLNDNFRKFSITATIDEKSLFLQKKIRRISISVKIFEQLRLQSQSSKNIDFTSIHKKCK